MFRMIRYFLRQNLGQDLAEYCMITAVVAIIALGIFIKVSGGIQAIWGTTNTTLASTPNSSGIK